MANTNITMRIDEKLKAQLQELMSDLGLDVTTFFTMAARQAVREQRIPFRIAREIPNKETIAAFDEVEEMKKNPDKIKSYSSFSELLQEVEHEI
ncbi:MAG: type II toxin-antitoxin system RelB/DinJ family antitoxin [Coprococcus sp.]|nr:type II toxin-antitoxin system RelB/DinJ family antitoxin [Coprococcus sp.]